MCYKFQNELKKDQEVNAKMVEILPSWLCDVIEAKTNSYKTKKDYLSKLKKYLEWLDLGKPTNEYTIEDVNVQVGKLTSYLKYLSNTMASTSVEAHWKTLASVYEYLFRTGEIKANMFEQINKKKFVVNVSSTTKEVKLPTVRQVDNLLDSILQSNQKGFSMEKNLMIVKFMLSTGLRLHEVIGIDVNDLYLEEDQPYIKVVGKGRLRDEEADKVYLGWVILHKSKDDEFIVDEEIVGLLKSYLVQREMYVTTGENALFISRDGKRLSENSISTNIIKRYSNGEVSPHMIRHYYGTMLYKKTKGNIAFVSEQMRHKDINTSMNRYVSAVIKEK